jgi:MFS family permease
LNTAPQSSSLIDRRVFRVYSAHGMASIASNLLITSFFFYAKRIFGWGSGRSLMLVSAEGAFYLVGALLAQRLAGKFGRRRALLGIQIVLALLTTVAWIRPTQELIVCALLAYTLISTAGWPILESLIAAGADATILSRRIGVYNLVWSSAGTLTLAISGTIIDFFPSGMFFIPMASHALAVAFVASKMIEPPGGAEHATHVEVEPELMRHRKLALILSRIALPATYTVVYSLVALMPSLRVIQSFSLASQTVVASIWMGARFAIFVVLGATSWWHTRPRLLLVASVLMLAAFCGVTLTGSGAADVSTFDQVSMIAWQLLLGVSIGMIYSSSLYFGMVLSAGSTEHGGYHEALIGAGQVIGPAAALIAERAYPGQTTPAVIAVAALLLATVAVAGVVNVRSE